MKVFVLLIYLKGDNQKTMKQNWEKELKNDLIDSEGIQLGEDIFPYIRKAASKLILQAKQEEKKRILKALEKLGKTKYFIAELEKILNK